MELKVAADAAASRFQRLLSEAVPGIRFETEIRANPFWRDVVACVVIILPPTLSGGAFRRAQYRDAYSKLSEEEQRLLAVSFRETR